MENSTSVSLFTLMYYAGITTAADFGELTKIWGSGFNFLDCK